MNDKTQTQAMKKRLQKASGITLSVSSTAWCLLRLNMLFLVFCVPVITAPAATAAMAKVLMSVTRGEDVGLWRSFWSEFKADFFKALYAGLVLAALAAAVGLIGYTVAQCGGFIDALGVAFIIVFGLWLYVVACYLFALIASVELSLSHCLRNAVLLALVEPKQNLLLLIPFALLAACVLLFPISLPLLLFVIFSLCQFIVCMIVDRVIQKRITSPHMTHSASVQEAADV